MKVIILHNEVRPGAPPEEADVLIQVETVGNALTGAGHEVSTLGCDLDLERLRRHLLAAQPAVVFNLVESLGGYDRLLPLVPELCDALALPYTGSPSAALLSSTSKLLTKRALLAASLSVPPVVAAWPPSPADECSDSEWSEPVIVKAVWEHGSAAMGDEAVLRPRLGPGRSVGSSSGSASSDGGADLRAILRQRATLLGGACFAEAFVEGREFNLSVVEGRAGLRVLPPAEIVFEGFPEEKPHIVGYRAKWEPSSFEYRHTPRRFSFPPADRPLLAELARLARSAFSACGLRGYGRVDFRVDAAGRAWILEVNANPCLSPDAGLAAAAAEAGIGLDSLIVEILDCAQRDTIRPAAAPALATT